ncbi:MAG TPA: DUF2934 domain-containing protein [Bryobacteraceae bacterium]
MQSLQIESDRQQKIQVAAYYLWQQRGSPLGTPELDWFRAEGELERQTEPASTRPVLVTAAETIGSALGSIAGAAASVTGLFHAEETSQSE